ncbi:MAG: alkaline shock response membrane anchor protein AmaP [Pseudonocardia sp.]|nr:alkaline shock response membrane anchor protein AmaP [Pseudonocardia sp.]
MSAQPGPAPGPTLAPAPRAVRKRSRKAVARSAAGDRWVAGLIGLILLLAGLGTALLAYGVFGDFRSSRPVLDPMIVDALRAQPLLWRIVALAVGVVLVVVGLVWAARSLRPEKRPDLVLDAGTDTAIVVGSGAAADAVADHAASLAGVGKARARMVGTASAPALRLTVWITDDADVAALCRKLETDVVAEARDTLGFEHLPVAVRLELDTAASAPRVA